jgi:hypothetical protein
VCESFLSWNMVAIIAAFAVIFLVVTDLLIRYLDNGGRGLIPCKAILSLFFLFSNTKFQDVDKRYRDRS